MKPFFTSLLLTTVFLFSCSSKQDIKSSLRGHWLVLYPDHQLRTKSEKDVYGKYQDSVVNLYGLKLVEFNPEGQFTEIDSLFKTKGQWVLTNENELQVREGGRGFNPFTTTVEGIQNDTLRLVQLLPLEHEKIKVVWHLKKVDEDTLAQKLVSSEANQWRRKPAKPESDAEIRKRLKSVLMYYSIYLKLVSNESSYFLIPRIHLPFRYYQHAIGMREKITPGFINLFYNENDAKKAYEILSQTITRLSNEFEWADNFVVEYSLFFKKMTYYID
jgi:hypothetical protein